MAQKKIVEDQFVLEQALWVISKYGPDCFTLVDVGKAVGLAPATLLQRFGSKQQLLILAAKQATASLQQDLQKLKLKKLAWDKELIQLLASVPKGFGTRQDIASSLGLLKLDMIDPELHPVASELFNTLRGRIHELLLDGQKSGQLDASFDLEVVMWELDALRHGLVIQWTLSGKGTLKKWLEKGFQNNLKRIKI